MYYLIHQKVADVAPGNNTIFVLLVLLILQQVGRRGAVLFGQGLRILVFSTTEVPDLWACLFCPGFRRSIVRAFLRYPMASSVTSRDTIVVGCLSNIDSILMSAQETRRKILKPSRRDKEQCIHSQARHKMLLKFGKWWYKGARLTTF